MKNIDPNAQQVWRGYGCVRCNVVHFEGSPLFKPHGMYQSKAGIQVYSAAERAKHLTASDQSVEEPAVDDVRNALMVLVSNREGDAGTAVYLTGPDATAVFKRLQAAVAKLERAARQERPYRKPQQD